MAVHKAIRSNSSAQPQPQPAKYARAGGPKPVRRRFNPQFKAELFDTLSRLNRGYGTALAALEKLQNKTRLEGTAIFPAACVRDYRNRTEILRGEANRDLLSVLVVHEDRDAARFSKGENSAEHRKNRS